MNVTEKIIPKIDVHKGQSVILCQFPYDKSLLLEFRKAFPYAKWSQSKKSWYVLDRAELRIIFHLPEKKQLDKLLNKINTTNQLFLELYAKTLQLKSYSLSTQKAYLGEFSRFLQFFEPKNVNELLHKQINQYFWHCIHELKLSENQVHSRINAVKFYYRFVVNLPIKLDLILRPKKKEMLPEVLSKKEVKVIFEIVENPKHLIILKLCYGMGLRVSEIINLKITDISSQRMQVHIRCAKGKKDRMVNLPTSVLDELRDYYKLYKPVDYLFEGQYGGQYTTRSVQAVFKRAMIKAKVNKKIGIHGLRHSFATHLLESVTDMVFIQKLLGHKNVKTTEIYAKVSNQILSKVKSPLDSF